MHVYSEASARAKLARHRLRGEEQFTFHCPWADHWHCIDRPLEEMAADGSSPALGGDPPEGSRGVD